MFVGKCYMPSIIFMAKSRSLPLEWSPVRRPLGKAPALPANIRLECKRWTVTKHSSLLWCGISGSECILKLFSLSLMFLQNKIVFIPGKCYKLRFKFAGNMRTLHLELSPVKDPIRKGSSLACKY